MKILLTADWQSQTSSLDLSRQALEIELSLIKKHKIDVHIDLGDSKEEYSPVAVGVSNFQVERSRKIAKLVGKDNAFRLLGNHDRIGQHSDNRNWLPIFTDHCHCIQSTELATIGDTLLAFLPFNKDIDATIGIAKVTSKRAKIAKAKHKLLFFHCDIKDAKYSNVRAAVSESKLSVQAMQHNVYEQCFGGHIHKRQTIAGNVHYIGNPFPTDMGEINQEKGFTIYDTATGKIKFISSGLPCIYTFDYLQKHSIKNVPDGTQIKQVVSVKQEDDYYKVLGDVSAKIEQKYPNSIPVVVPEFAEILAQTDDNVKIAVDSTELEQVKAYLDGTLQDAILRPALEEYIKYILSAVSKRTAYAKGITFDEVEAHNILSFKDVKFSFKKRGVCLVRGANKDWPGHSNGSGKSNLLALLPIAHSGKTFKDQKHSDIVNDFHKDDKAWARLKVSTRIGDKLDIYRQFNPSKLTLTVNGKDASQGCRSNGKKDTQGLIEELTGYTFSMLANAVYIDQTMTQSFLSGTEKDRAELLHKFQNLDRFYVAIKMVKQDYSLTKAIINDVEHSVDMQKMLLQETLDRLHELETIQKDHLGKLKTEYVKAQDAYTAYAEVTAHKIEQIKKMQSLADLCVDKQEKHLGNVRKELTRQQAALQFDRHTLIRLTKAVAQGTCSLCLQKIGKQHKTHTLAAIQKKIGTQKDKIASVEVEVVTETAKLKSLEEKVATLEFKVTSKQTELSRLKQVAVAAKRYYEQEKKSISADSVVALKNKIRLIKHTISQLGKLRNDYLDTLLMLGKAERAFGRDGLPLFLSRLLCPRLNAAAQYYAKLFVDNEIQVIFKLEENRLVPKIVNLHGGKLLSGQSKGEEAWAGIISSFALRDIAQKTNLLILDEPGTGLDTESAKQFGRHIGKLSKKFETLIVVTHNPLIESAIQDVNTVTVCKKNKVSYIA